MNFQERANMPKVEVAPQSMPFIGIKTEALAKMYHYVQECKDEIGWLGTVEKQGKLYYLIDDVFLFDQEVHATTTEISPEGLSKFAEELMTQPNGIETWNRMQVWGHSHVNMGVSPSGQDDKQMAEFQQTGHDFFIRLIANKKGELKLDLYNFAEGITFLDVPWEVVASGKQLELQRQIRELELALSQEHVQMLASTIEPIKAEMQTKVKKKVYATMGTRYGAANYDYQNEFGRYVNGVWTRWSAVDKSKSLAQVEIESNTLFNEEYEDPYTQSIYADIEYRDVPEMFTPDDLLAIAEARTWSQKVDAIEAAGYIESEFSIKDIETITGYAKANV